MTPAVSTWFTPPEVGSRFRVEAAKVRGWIESGQLAAINVATKGATRPRYRISEHALEAFLAGRAVAKPAPAARQRRRKPEHVIEYF